MTEAEWLECTDSARMLYFLRDEGQDHLEVAEHTEDPEQRVFFVPGWATGRKLRLFFCACCRRVWQMVKDRRFHDCVMVYERLIEGWATRKEWAEVSHDALMAPRPDGGFTDPTFLGMVVAAGLPGIESPHVAYNILDLIQFLFTIPAAANTNVNSPEWFAAVADEQAAECSLLRDIFGNPFRPVLIDPAILTWNSDTLRSLARAIYDECAFDRLPVLADALEEAGCTNADILNHCRQPGEHVRGCWVLDLLLGKE
jgi:hypothetical protein